MSMQTTVGKQPRGRPFKPEKSGNAAGRPPGARNRAAVMADVVALARAVDEMNLDPQRRLRADGVRAGGR